MFDNKIYIFDFDDTLWSRDKALLDVSIDNLSLLQVLSTSNKVAIISGNSIGHIKECFSIAGIFPEYDIWADSNSTLYVNFNKIKVIDDFLLPDIDLDYIRYLFPINIRQNIASGKCFIKIKPLFDNNYRRYICDKINNYLFDNDICAVAIPTGKTSIDILSKSNNKSVLLREYKGHFIFFGDEIKDGNDAEIAKLCDDVFECSSVLDTNRRLRELCCMDW